MSICPNIPIQCTNLFDYSVIFFEFSMQRTLRIFEPLYQFFYSVGKQLDKEEGSSSLCES